MLTEIPLIIAISSMIIVIIMLTVILGVFQTSLIGCTERGD